MDFLALLALSSNTQLIKNRVWLLPRALAACGPSCTHVHFVETAGYQANDERDKEMVTYIPNSNLLFCGYGEFIIMT